MYLKKSLILYFRIGYQYNQPYRYPYYRMAPVYSWYQHDQPPVAKTEPEMEPKTEGKDHGKS